MEVNMEGQITIFSANFDGKTYGRGDILVGSWKTGRNILRRKDRIEWEKFWEGVSCKWSRIEEKEDLLHMGMKVMKIKFPGQDDQQCQILQKHQVE